MSPDGPDGPAAMVADGAASVQATVLERGGEPVSTGAGDLGGGEPGRTRFRAGSVTKLLVATAVTRLAADGALGLDATVDSVLPGAFPTAAGLTVEQLLGHTGGLAEYSAHVPLYAAGRFGEHAGPGFAAWFESQLARVWTDAEIAELIARDEPDPALRGTFAYSNSNYWILGEVLSAVTGTPWRTHLEATILEPLGMTATTLPGGTRDLPAPAARAWQEFAEHGAGLVEVTRCHPSVLGASGEIVSTTEDLARFLRALQDGELVPPGTLAAMQERSTASPLMAAFGIVRYGLGLISFETPCGTGRGAAGTVNGYSTALYASPDGARVAAVTGAERRMPFTELAQRVVGLTRALLCP